MTRVRHGRVHTALAVWLLLGVPFAPAQDPEATPEGRSTYLGRPVAHTMHWTGAAWLLRATREQEENGVLLRKWLDVQPGQTVCDLGCGNGYHTLPLAEAVGKDGLVYAVELQPKLLEMLELRARPRGIENLRYVECTVDDPRLPASSCDLVLLVDVYHEMSHPVRVMQAVKRALRPGGRVVLVEFRAEDPEVPIKPEHTMTKAQVLREMAEHGFALADETDALPWQHAMSFVPAPADPRLGARQTVQGFLRAAAGGDDRVVAPFLADEALLRSLPALAADDRAELEAGPDGSLVARLRTTAGERLPHDLDELVLGRDEAGRWLVREVRATTDGPRGHGSSRPFVAMHTGTGNAPLEQQAAMVRELGFDGMECPVERTAETRRACEAAGTDLRAAYGVLDLVDIPATESDPVRFLAPRLEPIRRAMRELAGGPGMLWLALRHERAPLGDTAGDPAAWFALRQLLEESRTTGVEIALYPHKGFWVESVDHAVRLAARIADPRLGVCFNLCHHLATSDDTDVRPVLGRCGKLLLAATVGGADTDGTDWSTLIQPLGRGSHPLGQFLEGLDALGFQGPVGLQAFGITLPPRDHLAESMTAWRAAHAR